MGPTGRDRGPLPGDVGRDPVGVLSTTVPGVISALLTMLSHYGTMSFSQVSGECPELCPRRFSRLSALAPDDWQSGSADELQKYPDSARVYLPNGKPPALGSLFTQPDLARTLTLMVEAEQQALGQGQSHAAALQTARDVFYKGDVARHGAGLARPRWAYTYEDFAEYTSPLEEPLSTTYRGHQLFTNRTWTQGITLLQALNILEGYDLAMGHNSPQAIHVQVEALNWPLPTGKRTWVIRPTSTCQSRVCCLGNMRPCGVVSSIPTSSGGISTGRSSQDASRVTRLPTAADSAESGAPSGATQTVPRTWPRWTRRGTWSQPRPAVSLAWPRG